MNPQREFCHNPSCRARGQTGKGNIVVHSIKERRYRCTECEKTFSQTSGTVFYRAKTAYEVVTLVLTLLAHGCPIQAVVAAFGFDERTVSDWLHKAGEHAHQVHLELVEGQKRDLEFVQADEMWVKTAGGRLWMAMAMAVPYRLWLGGVISRSRDSVLIRYLAYMIRRCAKSMTDVLICTDGMKSYVKALLRAFSHPENTGNGYRSRLVVDAGLMIGQVIKSYSGRRLVEVVHNAVLGSAEAIRKKIVELGCGGDINTSYIERLNASFRSRSHGLIRRGRGIVHKQRLLECAMWLVGCTYNFCLNHDSLRILSGDKGDRKWHERTPAMAAGITDHQWTVWELLWHRVAAPVREIPREPFRGGSMPKWMEWMIDDEIALPNHG